MRVGFVGLGDIGMPMAQCLLDAGFQVVVLDTKPQRMQTAAESGARQASTVDDFAECDVVGVAVPDDDVVLTVLIEDGLLAALPDGAVVLIHTTVLPETARRLAEQAPEFGVFIVDAPVSGGAARARTGDLTIMAGGDETVLERASQVLDTLSSETIRVGAPGAGAAVKLANQLAMLASLAALYEGLALASEYDVPEDLVLRTLAGGTGDSWVLRNWGFFDDLARNYDESQVALHYRPWCKDLWDMVAAARSKDLRVPLAGLLAQVLPDTVEQHAAGAAGQK